MNCTEYRESHPLDTPAGREHLSSCADCRAFAASWEILREYPPVAPGADFFRGVRRKLAPKILRFAAPVAAAAAALLMFALLTVVPAPRGPAVTDEERELVENLDLLQNYELLRTFDLVNDSSPSILEERK